MYKAVFIDLDGTLLRKDHSIGELTRDAIKRIMAKGIAVVLVSARPLDAILPIAESIGTTCFPIASLNGGYIVAGNELLFQSVIDVITVTGLTGEIKKFTDTIVYYVEREWFAEVNNKWIEHEQHIMDVKIRVEPFNQIATYLEDNQTGPSKLMVMADPDVVAPTAKHLQSLYPHLNIYPSQATNLEVMNTDASKANAVKLLLSRLQVKQEEVIALGDNYNDKEMIRFAGLGIAMGNAPQEIKDAADYVTDTNNNDGVGKALNKFIK